MIYNFEKLSFQILTIDRFSHITGLYKTEGRPFASISIRLKGNGYFKTDGKCFLSRPGDVTFLPENIRYTTDYDGGECIAVHLCDCNYNSIENITPKNIDEIKEIFFELLKIKDDLEKINEKKSLVYKLLQCLCEQSKSDTRSSIIRQSVHYINEHYSDPNTDIPNICKHVNVSEATLRRKFNEYFGIPPKQYLMKTRLSKAAAVLIKAEKTVKETAAECGFADEKYFSRCIKQAYGISPSNLQKK